MAILDVDYDVRRATILFEQPIPARLLNSGQIMLLGNNEVGHQIYMTFLCDFSALPYGTRLIPRLRPEKFVELVARDIGNARIGFLENDAFVGGEPLRLSSRLLRDMYDPIRLNSNYIQLPKKFARLAVFTQTYNEGDMLLYWEKYYGGLVGHENLYVLNNGSTDGSCQRLHPKTNLINMPTGPVDHEHFAQSHSFFQRFLLTKYDWVIKVDADEFVVFEGGLVETLEATAGGTYRPEHAVEVIHDRRTEPAFSFDRGVFAQRRHAVRGTDLLLRPIISSVPSSWTAGNHMATEHNEPLPGCYVVHLKYFDFDYLHEKNTKWSRMEQTDNEGNVCKAISGLREVSDELEAFSAKEITDRLADDPIHIPAWLSAKF